MGLATDCNLDGDHQDGSVVSTLSVLNRKGSIIGANAWCEQWLRTVLVKLGELRERIRAASAEIGAGARLRCGVNTLPRLCFVPHSRLPCGHAVKNKSAEPCKYQT
jgi:hypothetical protein